MIDDIEVVAVKFGTEGPFMQALGMETVVFGAGSIEMLGWQLRVQLLARGDADGGAATGGAV